VKTRKSVRYTQTTQDNELREQKALYIYIYIYIYLYYTHTQDNELEYETGVN